MLVIKIRQMAPLYETKLLNLVRMDIFSRPIHLPKILQAFGSFLDIPENAEWPRFLDPPVYPCRYIIICITINAYMYTAVVVYCHSLNMAMARFLFRAQDNNMTNGDFVYFTFRSRRTSSTDRPWTRTEYGAYVDDPDDLPRRRRAFYAVKQVLAF